MGEGVGGETETRLHTLLKRLLLRPLLLSPLLLFLLEKTQWVGRKALDRQIASVMRGGRDVNKNCPAKNTINVSEWYL